MDTKTVKHDPRIIIQALASAATTLLRANRGIIATGHRAQPAQLLELYDGEYCPYCRLVREALTELDIDARIYPIPKKAKRYRDQLLAVSGAKKIPFLHDPNTGVKLHDSAAIVEYLYKQYGIEGIPAPERNLKTSMLATLSRGTKGMFAAPSAPAEEPLELYSFEGSPYVRLVRELLCELETTYIVRNVGKSPGSYADFFPPILRHNAMQSYLPATVNRQKFIERAGLMMVPYLVDSNTDTAMWQTGDIQKYLRETYGGQRDAATQPTAKKAVAKKPAQVRIASAGKAKKSPAAGQRAASTKVATPPAASGSRKKAKSRAAGATAPATNGVRVASATATRRAKRAVVGDESTAIH